MTRSLRDHRICMSLKSVCAQGQDEVRVVVNSTRHEAVIPESFLFTIIINNADLAPSCTPSSTALSTCEKTLTTAGCDHVPLRLLRMPVFNLTGASRAFGRLRGRHACTERRRAVDDASPLWAYTGGYWVDTGASAGPSTAHTTTQPVRSHVPASAVAAAHASTCRVRVPASPSMGRAQSSLVLAASIMSVPSWRNLASVS
jgi:hypothetical protein